MRWNKDAIYFQAIGPLEGATLRALEKYNAVECSDLELNYGVDKMDVGIHFGTPAELDGLLGATKLLINDDGDIITAEILVKEATTPEERPAIIMHEIGHALGLPESHDEGSLMYPSSTKDFVTADVQVQLCNYETIVEITEYGSGCSYLEQEPPNIVSAFIFCFFVGFLVARLIR